MIQLQRINELARLMRAESMDALIVGPNTDLTYLAGLSPFLDERFKSLVILKDGRFFHICPELYYEETREALGPETDIFVWSDTDGFLKAADAANHSYHLDHMTIGINDAVRAVDLLSLGSVVTATFVVADRVLEQLRVCKSAEERDFLRMAARIADEVAAEILPSIHPGTTEQEVKKKIGELFAAKGTPELAFETIVASGPNSSRPHYMGGSRVITDHDVANSLLPREHLSWRLRQLSHRARTARGRTTWEVVESSPTTTSWSWISAAGTTDIAPTRRGWCL